MFPAQKTEEIKLLDGQLIATILFGINLGISFILLYNQKLVTEEKEPLFNKQTFNDLILINKIFALILLLYFLYASYVSFLNTEEGEKKKDATLQLLSSILVVIASLVTLYVILKNYNGTIPFIEVENPEV